MSYYFGLTKKQRERIFHLFLENYKLKFNEIEKKMNIQSNELSYHLGQMVKEGMLEKSNKSYSLTKQAEGYLPLFSNIRKRTLNPVAVVLTAVIKNSKILLIKRKRRPYKDYWCMIGGKIFMDETIKDATIRLIKEKSSITGKYVSLNAVVHERITDGGSPKNSFMLFFTKVNAKDDLFKEGEDGELRWFDLKDLNQEEIVPSDFWLIKNKLNSKLDAIQFDMPEKDGRLKYKNSKIIKL